MAKHFDNTRSSRGLRLQKSEEVIDDTSSFAISLTSLSIILLAFFIFLNSFIKPDPHRAASALKSVKTHLALFPRGAPLQSTSSETLDVSAIKDLQALSNTLQKELPQQEIEFASKPDRVTFTVPTSSLFRMKNGELILQPNIVLDSLTTDATHTDLVLEIDLHTGSDTAAFLPEYSNWEFTLQQAALLQRFFSKNGFLKERLRVRAHGEFKPAFSNDLPEGRRKNERVVFTILPRHNKS